MVCSAAKQSSKRHAVLGQRGGSTPEIFRSQQDRPQAMYLDKLSYVGRDLSTVKPHHEQLTVHLIKAIPRGRRIHADGCQPRQRPNVAHPGQGVYLNVRVCGSPKITVVLVLHMIMRFARQILNNGISCMDSPRVVEAVHTAIGLRTSRSRTRRLLCRKKSWDESTTRL